MMNGGIELGCTRLLAVEAAIVRELRFRRRARTLTIAALVLGGAAVVAAARRRPLPKLPDIDYSDLLADIGSRIDSILRSGSFGRTDLER